MQINPFHPPSAVSVVWQHFRKDNDGGAAYCNYCSQGLFAHRKIHDGTSHLWRHLWTHHCLEEKLDIGVEGIYSAASKIVGNILGTENEEAKETDAQQSGSRHLESPLELDRRTMPPKRTRKPAASIDGVEHKFSGETTEMLDTWPTMLNMPMDWNGQTTGRRHPMVQLENKKAAASIDVVQHGFSQVPAIAETSRGKSQVCIDALPHGFSQEPTNAARSKRESKVWQHFRVDKDRVRAYCIHCTQDLAADSRNGTSHLARHLTAVHGFKKQADGHFCKDVAASTVVRTNTLVTGNEEPKETDAQNSATKRHLESSLALAPKRMRKPAASIDDAEAQHCFSGDGTSIAKSRGRSEVWQHFREDKDGGRAYCNHCSNNYAAATEIGTSRLWRHLEKDHNIFPKSRASSSKDGN